MPDQPTRDRQPMVADHEAARAAETEAEHGYGWPAGPKMSNEPLSISGETGGIILLQTGSGSEAVSRRETDIWPRSA